MHKIVENHVNPKGRWQKQQKVDNATDNNFTKNSGQFAWNLRKY